jgi:drug/metabolite transporter (DMT)-like permease
MLSNFFLRRNSSSNRIESLETLMLLVLPPIFWAGNAIVGRLMVGVIPPMALNFGRWTIALVVLLPFCHRYLRRPELYLSSWPRYFVLGTFGICGYNAFMYLALETSSPINVTLVASSIPVFILLVGRVFYGVAVSFTALIGVTVSIIGVLIVISGGSLTSLMTLRLVPGDLLMVLAALSWAIYSWMLVKPGRLKDNESLKSHWISFLAIQIAFGALSALCFAVIEWAYWQDTEPYQIHLGLPLLMALLYVAIFPGIVAFRAWGLAVDRVGPSFAGIMVNLTPMLAAFLSLLVLGESPVWYHLLAFVCILSGIVIFQSGRPR